MPRIHMQSAAFAPKPSGKSFYACAENRLVQISPWNYEYHRDMSINREVCLVMNELVRVIAGVGDGWWEKLEENCLFRELFITFAMSIVEFFVSFCNTKIR